MSSVIWWWNAGHQPLWGRGIGWHRLKILQVPHEGVLPNEHLCGYVVYDRYTTMSLEGFEFTEMQILLIMAAKLLNRGNQNTKSWQPNY